MQRTHWLICLSTQALIVIGCLGCQPPSNVAASNQEAEEAAPIEAQKATTGVGKRGQSLQDNTGPGTIISGPAAALFRVEQKVVFEIQIPQALQLYQALEGKPPGSHEEFMEKIIQANRIQLPELPDGAVYRFDPEKGELWVYPEAETP